MREDTSTIKCLSDNKVAIFCLKESLQNVT